MDNATTYIKTAIKTETIDEMASALNKTPRQIRYLIDRYHLDQYCELPATDRVWELIRDDKVQCAVCGMWMLAINGAHLSKHDLSIAEYKAKFGLNKKQPLCCKKLSQHWRDRAAKIGFGTDKIASSGQKLFATGKIKPHSYLKSKQAIAHRIESGIQSKAGGTKKPREYLKHVDAGWLKDLRDKERLSFQSITKTVEDKTGYKLSETTIKRIYYGRRDEFKK